MRTSAIQLHNVGLRRGEDWLLRGVSWTVEPGTCAAIVGPNGSGKSTLARILACHIWPTEGQIDVLGGHFGDVSLPDIRQHIRLVQPAGPYDIDPELTAREIALTGFFGTIGLYDSATAEMRDQADELLGKMGLSHVAGHRYATLSSGERVRSLIARALVIRPRLLILDEPTAGLDLRAREQVLATVQEMFDRRDDRTPTVVLITHHVEELPPATSQILLLDGGRVASAGKPAQVLRSEVLSAVYQVEVDVHETDGRYHLHVNPGNWQRLLDSRRK